MIHCGFLGQLTALSAEVKDSPSAQEVLTDLSIKFGSRSTAYTRIFEDFVATQGARKDSRPETSVITQDDLAFIRKVEKISDFVSRVWDCIIVCVDPLNQVFSPTFFETVFDGGYKDYPQTLGPLQRNLQTATQYLTKCLATNGELFSTQLPKTLCLVEKGRPSLALDFQKMLKDSHQLFQGLSAVVNVAFNLISTQSFESPFPHGELMKRLQRTEAFLDSDSSEMEHAIELTSALCLDDSTSERIAKIQGELQNLLKQYEDRQVKRDNSSPGNKGHTGTGKKTRSPAKTLTGTPANQSRRKYRRKLSKGLCLLTGVQEPIVPLLHEPIVQQSRVEPIVPSHKSEKKAEKQLFQQAIDELLRMARGLFDEQDSVSDGVSVTDLTPLPHDLQHNESIARVIGGGHMIGVQVAEFKGILRSLEVNLRDENNKLIISLGGCRAQSWTLHYSQLNGEPNPYVSKTLRAILILKGYAS